MPRALQIGDVVEFHPRINLPNWYGPITSFLNYGAQAMVDWRNDVTGKRAHVKYDVRDLVLRAPNIRIDNTPIRAHVQ